MMLLRFQLSITQQWKGLQAYMMSLVPDMSFSSYIASIMVLPFVPFLFAESICNTINGFWPLAFSEVKWVCCEKVSYIVSVMLCIKWNIIVMVTFLFST